MKLTIKTNIEKLENKLTLLQRIKNKIDFKKCNKQTKEEKTYQDDEKVFQQTLVVDEIMEEDYEK